MRRDPSPSIAIVLYACSGSLGHRVLAENYLGLLRAIGFDAIAVDVLQLDGRPTFHRYSELYFWVLKSVPALWRWLYRYWMRVPILDFIRQDVLPTRFTRTRRLLCSVKPDLVISTHPVSTGIVNNLKRRGQVKCPLWTAFSDWHVQRYWMFPEVTHYLVPLEEQRSELEQLGVRASRVSVVGMLLRQEYYKCLPRTIPVSLAKSSRSVLVIGGGKGWALESVLRQLRGTVANVVVIAGSSDRKRQIEQFLATQTYGQHWVILGFVDPLPYLVAADLVIAKPGGLSTAEILHLKKPLILVSAMPGHEEENARVLSEYGIPWVKQLDALPSLVNQYLTFGGPKVRALRSEEFTSPALVFQALQSNLPSFQFRTCSW